MYLLVKRCSMLYLYANNGTFGPSPYLDVHGEADISMRYVRRCPSYADDNHPRLYVHRRVRLDLNTTCASRSEYDVALRLPPPVARLPNSAFDRQPERNLQPKQIVHTTNTVQLIPRPSNSALGRQSKPNHPTETKAHPETKVYAPGG